MHNKLDNIVNEVKQLKESLIKETEQAILEKYSKDIEEKLEVSLNEEVDPLTGENLPDGDEDAKEVKESVDLKKPEVNPDKKVGDNEEEQESVEVTLNLESLQEEVQRVLALGGDVDLEEPTLETEDEPRFQAQLSLQGNDEENEERYDLQVGSDDLTMDELLNFLETFDVDEDEEEITVEPTEMVDPAQQPTMDESNCGTKEEGKLEEGKYELEEEELRQFFQSLSGSEHEPVEELEEELDISKISDNQPGMADGITSESAKEQRDINSVREVLRKLNDKYNKNKKEKQELEEQLDTYKDILQQLKESCQDLNTSNTKLKYQLETYKDTTLNTRQKRIMADKISMCESIDHAKLVFETLTEAVKTRSYRKPMPEDLREAMNGKGGYLVIQESQNKKDNKEVIEEGLFSEAFKNRMKQNAGLL